MNEYANELIELAISEKALEFGSFTLKSGRVSPYFFNMGKLNSGKALSLIGKAYAKCITDNKIPVDVVYGPAYKGITIASSTCMALAKQGIDAGYSFHRKETKDHGEGGNLVGCEIFGNLVIVDDVITKGTAVNESIMLLSKYLKASIKAIIVLLDREEIAEENKTAIELLRAKHGLQVFPVLTLKDLLKYSKTNLPADIVNSIEQYQQEFCI